MKNKIYKKLLHLKTYTISNTGEIGHFFELERHQEVDNLFQDIVDQVRPMLEYKDISTDMFYIPEEIEMKTEVCMELWTNLAKEFDRG